jgi:hypothetical protein
MPRIESNIFVQKSLEDTFAFLNTPESHLKFIPRCVEFRQTSAGGFGQIGTTIKEILNYFGIRIPVDYEMIEHAHNQSLAMKGQMGPITFKDGYVLSASNAGTDIKFWLELNLTGWMKIFSPFAGLIGKTHAWETLRNLKREIASSSLRASSQ